MIFHANSPFGVLRRSDCRFLLYKRLLPADRSTGRRLSQSMQEAATSIAPADANASAAAGSGNTELKKQKRNVALHVGYVGTNYTGLQANRDLPELATIEAVLEKAILQAGLISQANFGDFRKTKWTRSSRTDKGVHSLATVVGLRVLVRDEEYETDPEGIGYAKQINQHLPPDIRVFAVQRTNKSFNARRWCGSRTYEYYLPAAALGLETPDGSSSSDQQKLEQLREALQQFCGYRAFHNYAGNRSQYVGQKAKAARRKAKREAQSKAGELAAAQSTSESSWDALSSKELEEQQQEQKQQQQQQQLPMTATAADSCSDSVLSSSIATATTTAESDEGEAAESETEAEERQLYAEAINWEYSGEGAVPPELFWRQQAKFLSGPDPDDPVVKSHYRMIRSFTADDPGPLVEGGMPCLRLEVCGDSFMLHQIRHMVGVAVAIVRGIMPRELLDVSLSAPGRVTVPRAPPHTLLLSGSLFSPFPAGWGLESPIVAQWTGNRLQLRERGQAEMQEFRKQVFDAAMNQLLLHPDWDAWSRKVLPRYQYAAEDVTAAVDSYSTWYAALKEKRAAEAAAKAAEWEKKKAETACQAAEQPVAEADAAATEQQKGSEDVPEQ